MTSKLRFLGDGTADVYVNCYFCDLAACLQPYLDRENPTLELKTPHRGPELPLSETSRKVGLPLISYLQKSNCFSYPLSIDLDYSAVRAVVCLGPIRCRRAKSYKAKVVRFGELWLVLHVKAFGG